MIEKKSYVIQGRQLTQGEMTLGQTKRVLCLAAELSEAKGITEIRDAASAVAWLVEKNLVDKVLDIILVGDKEGIVWDDLTNSQLEAIVSDFLAFNGGWIRKLSSSLEKLRS